ncbi:MAG: hypothetical protein GC162_09270 [Planctomycetes bacterium]|nr:hypothetical protein [Planctomycetota bacterium]
MGLGHTTQRSKFAAMVLAAVIGSSASAHASTTGYWRAESDTNGGGGLSNPNEVAGGNPLTASAASVDFNPASLPVKVIPQTGAINTGTFDGNNDLNATVTSYAALDSGSITVELWVRSAEGSGTLISRTDGSSSGFTIGDFTGLDLTYYTDDGIGGSVTHTMSNVFDPNTTWHHFAWTYDQASGVGRTYVDGAVTATDTGTAGQALRWTGAGDLKVGNGVDGGTLSSPSINAGFLDEIRLSDVALPDYQFLAAPGLAVDFGAGGQDVNPYFQEFSRGTSANNFGQAGPITEVYDSVLGNSGTVSVSVSGEGGINVDFRDRGDVTFDSIGDVLEDHIKGQTAGLLLTLTDLAQGWYDMTSFHHEGQNGTNAGGAGNLIDIYVSDALGSNRLVVDNLVTSGGTSPSSVAMPTYMIYSDGVNPITIFFDDVSPSDHETVLNGFTLIAVPNPAALPAGLALMGLLMVRRRK